MQFSSMLVLLLTLSAFAQQKTTDAVQNFPGTYEQLKPQQKQLVDDWYAEYNRMMHEHDSPKDYDQLSLSTRTTFEAVSHALMTTPLTDKSGQSLGNALGLVQSIETINGKVPKARGDLQFRVYVVLKPNALETLKQSTQFFRDRDNTVYHHGYPLNYRQDGGTPSIQISMARDGKHADIDVDYRSSKIPAALFNGHLTAANSDVRAGNNTQRHLQRWTGLTDWWRNLFGLADSEEDSAANAAAAGEVPPIPRKGAGRLDDAVEDFLSSWLVEEKPELAASYLSSRSFSCLQEYGPQAGKEINAGVAPYLAARDMAATSKLLDKPTTLENAAISAPLDDPNLKLIQHRYGTVFALYRVPDGVAPEFECDPGRAYDDYDKSRLDGTKTKYGRYFVAVFQPKPPHRKGEIVTTLWTKEGKYWKVVSWDVEPEDAKRTPVPDTRTAVSAAPMPETRISGDEDFLQASNQFLHAWLIADNFDTAAQYFSSQYRDCVRFYLAPDEEQPTTTEQYSAYLKKTLATIAQDVGTVQHLRDVIEPIAPDHDDLKVVKHTAHDAYTVVAVPDSLAAVFACRQRSTTHPYEVPAADSQGKIYGKYFATLFALRTPGDHPAALTFLWSKVDGKWKIISYELITP